MLASLAIALAAPWLSPLSFHVPTPGWHVGRSGTFTVTQGPRHARVPMSTAWTTNVRYLDDARSDPPNKTLMSFPSRGVIVWASIQPLAVWQRQRRVSADLSLADAYRFPCCEAVRIGGAWDIYAFGPRRAYWVLVRIYWGSPPSARMKAQAQHAINALRLPKARP